VFRRWAVEMSPDFVVKVVGIELLLIVLTQKVALPLGGDAQVEFSLIVHLLTLVVLLVTRNVHVDVSRAVVYLATILIAATVHIVNGMPEFSLPSLMLYAALYATFVFVIPVERRHHMRILGGFQTIAVGIAAVTALNWATQLVHIPWPSLDDYLPTPWKFREFAYIQPIYWGASLYKPNAFVFLETSILGQFLALAFVIETYFFQRTLRMAIYFGAALSTLSGTALILMAVSLPLLVGKVRLPMVLGLILALPIGLAAAVPLGLFEQIERRSTEFDREGSSGHQRFLAPILLMAERMEGDSYVVMVGTGAGNISRGFNIAWTALTKSFYEYGLLFSVVWNVLMVMALFGRGRPLVLSWALFVQYHFLNGSFIVPLFPVFHFALLGGYAISDDRPPHAPEDPVA
jgi:hypothetical protein